MRAWRLVPGRWPLVLLLILSLCCSTALGQPEKRLFEEEPYDEIRLKDSTVVRVQPLELKDRKLPEKPRSFERLIVRLHYKPGEKYEVTWGNIAEVKLFEQLVLDEAARLVNEKNFAEAYEYYRWLQQNRPTFPGIDAAVERYLYLDAGSLHASGRHDEALAVLNELHVRNPKFDGLAGALAAATTQLFETYVAAENFRGARGLVRSLADKFPKEPAAGALRGRLTAEADRLVEQSRQEAMAGNYPAAHDLAGTALGVWPDHEAGRKLLVELHQRFPRVVVGVAQPVADDPQDRLDDRAGRRAIRLLRRRLVEFQGYGPQGGQYAFPFGTVEKLELGRQLSIRLNPGIRWSTGDNELTGYDVARRLLRRCEPNDPAYEPQWAELLDQISVRDVYEVQVNLRRTHVQVDALLQTTLVPSNLPLSPDESPPSNGPYVLASREDGDTRFLANEQYFAAGAMQPRELIERHFRDTREGIAALKRGAISVLERINPWDLSRVESEPDLAVGTYAIPSVHCLWVNHENPLLAQRSFRRALVYGINRWKILEQQLLREASTPDSRVISGPFVLGRSFEDPMGYAYDESLDPRPYEPLVAMTLANIGLREAAAIVKSQGSELKEMPTLTLGYPPEDVPEVACRAIQRQLEPLGIHLELKEMPPQAPRESYRDYDLVYLQLAMWEPVVDARRLLGPEGIVGQASPYMELALGRLEQADEWGAARKALRQIHQIAYEDTSVVPLWQMTDYFAYHRSLRGISDRPVLLYENIEQWQTAPWLPSDSP